MTTTEPPTPCVPSADFNPEADRGRDQPTAEEEVGQTRASSYGELPPGVQPPPPGAAAFFALPHPELRDYAVLGFTVGPTQYQIVWPLAQLDGIIQNLLDVKRLASPIVVVGGPSRVPGFRGHKR